MSNADQLPIQVVLVVEREQDMTGNQAFLIERLQADPKIDLVGKTLGAVRRKDPALSVAVKAVLHGERLLMKHRILNYDTDPAKRILDKLPDRSKESEPEIFDIALALGADSLMPEALSTFRFGEWSISFAGAVDPSWIAVAPAVRTEPRVKVEVLSRTAQNPDPVVLNETSYNTKPGAVLTGAFVAEKSNLLVLHTLWKFADRQPLKGGTKGPTPCPKPPNFGELLTYCSNFLSKAFQRIAERSRVRKNRGREFWRIARGLGDVTDFAPSNANDLPVKAHIMADPFLFEHDGEMWVFYEAMNADGGNGWIECARLSDKSEEPSFVALSRPYHLSFPFVFQEDGEIFMIPETQQSKRLEVWKATVFPTEWTLHATAFEGTQMAETSLFQADDGQWWLFTNLSDHYAFQDHSSELYLFAVDGPDLNSITPHPSNPVVVGAYNARNGGAVIRQNGRLFRPAQNNSYGIYGYGLNLMEITRLDATGYEEQLVRQFTPADKPGSLALHHLSAAKGQYVFDWGGQ